jgi:tetratricopeptide (TPR) repeat protein
MGLFKMGQAENALGDYPRAIECFERALRGFPDTEANPSRSLGIPAIIGRTWLATSLADVGRFDEAVAQGERARAQAETAQQIYSIFYAIFQLGRVHLVRGDGDRAVELLEQSAALAEAWHIGLMRGACADHLAYAYVLAGRREAARAILQPLALPPRSYAALRAVHRGEAYLGLEQTEASHAEARQALDLARRFDERGQEARALALLAAIAAHRADGAAEADRLYRDALARAEALEMRPLAARCRLGLECLAAVR